ncbi:hypothetical protein KCP71_04430 [Salmonella enterica subsp. enterica]|nr:hypothetical protein KCP71_04430 [Salmonella enterica subsp. enterica]
MLSLSVLVFQLTPGLPFGASVSNPDVILLQCRFYGVLERRRGMDRRQVLCPILRSLWLFRN